jgi:hypothetical protein
MDKVSEINTLVKGKTRNELVLMCKEKNLPHSGTKHDMAVRLVGGLTEKTTSIVQKIPMLVIPRVNGKWVFQDIVFDDNTKNAVGRLLPDGSVGPLQRKQIDLCKQYKFKYILPECLDERPDPSEIQKNDSSDEEYDPLEDEDENDEES